MKGILAVLTLVALSPVAAAEFPVGKVGVNVAPRADFDLDTPAGDADGDGNGFGFYGEVGSDSLFVYIDHQTANLDIEGPLTGTEEDLDLTETRTGLALRSGSGQAALVARVEHYRGKIDFETLEDTDDDGVGVHLGGELPLGDSRARLFGSLGFLALDDLDGNEFRLGASGRLSDIAEVFAVYRMATLEGDADEEVELSDVRLGVNLLF